MPLPVVTVVQVGALPLTGVQVVMEATAVARKPVNPHGLAFLSAESADQRRTAGAHGSAGRKIGGASSAARCARPGWTARTSCG